jgi:cell division protein FtsB
MDLDPRTLAIGAAVGGGVGTLATLVVVGLVIRFTYRMWRDFDQLRTDAMIELRAENDYLRKRIEALEKKVGLEPAAEA